MTYGRIAITGGTGRLGSYVVPPTRDDIEFVQADIFDVEALTTAFAGHDAVMHLAAIPNVFAAPPETIMKVNVQGTWNVLQAAESAGVKRVVLCSSDSATGYTLLAEHMKMPRYLPVDESHVMRPSDPYGLSKFLGEEIGRSFVRGGTLEVVALRPNFILFDDFREEVSARANDPANYNEPVAGVPRGAGGGPWCHYVEPADVAQAFWLALELREVSFDAFFISAASTYAPEPTLDFVERFFGKLPEVRKPDVYRNNAYAPLFDLSRARDFLGFEASGTVGRRLADDALGRG